MKGFISRKALITFIQSKALLKERPYCWKDKLFVQIVSIVDIFCIDHIIRIVCIACIVCIVCIAL